MDNFHKIERLYGKENKVMKNMKVRTKLNLILVLVILLVALGSVVSVKNMEDVKDKALETMAHRPARVMMIRSKSRWGWSSPF